MLLVSRVTSLQSQTRQRALLPRLESVLAGNALDHALAQLPQRSRQVSVLRLRGLSAQLGLRLLAQIAL